MFHERIALGLPSLAGYTLAQALSAFRHVSIHQAWDDRWRAWIDCAVWAGAGTVTVHSGRPQEDERASAFIARRVPGMPSKERRPWPS